LVPIDFLYTTSYRLSIVTSTIALHLTLNVSETVRDRSLVPK